MKRFVINGANGYIASNFINCLLRNGHHVIALVRGSDNESAKQRMLEALRDCPVGIPPELSKLEVYSYALTEENMNLDNKTIAQIFATQIEYYHFAACLKFSAKTKNEIFGTNIDGLENSIHFFKKFSHKDARFFFISTAYSCGKIDTVFEERFYENADINSFRNYYELSKRLAENIIKRHIEEEGLNAYILRPSQVIGDLNSGITKTYFGIFDFIKRLTYIARRYPNQVIRIKANSEASQNLVPIDIVVHYLYATTNNDNLSQIIHLVSHQSTKNKDILKIVNELLPIKVEFDMELEKSQMTALEKIIDVGMSFTGSYTNSHIEFSTQKLDTIKPKNTPSLDSDSLNKMIKYFVKECIA